MPRKILAALAVVGIAGALDAPARADLETAGRAVIQSMSEAVLASLHAGTDHATREAHFGEMYRRNFDNAGLAAWAAGRAYTVAPPGQRKQYHQLFEHYVVKSYAAQLQQHKGERLRIDKSETVGRNVIVTSNLVPPDPRNPREIEMKWRLRMVGGRFLVTDVVIDKISTALTEKRAFAEWLHERGGTLEGLIGKLREKIAREDRRRRRQGVLNVARATRAA